MNYAMRGDRVVVDFPLDTFLHTYIGCKGTVIENKFHCGMASLIIRLDIGPELSFTNVEINVIPPPDVPFQLDDSVKILQGFDRTIAHICKTRLVGQVGKIRAYDRRDATFKIKCADDEGWFPAKCLIPLNFQGDHFYLPGEIFEFEGATYTVNKIRTTKLGWGQLIWVDDRWVPSSEVKLKNS